MLGGDKAAVAFHGDHEPVSIYVDGQIITEPAESTKSGASVEFEGTYNDAAEVSVAGKSTQETLTGKNICKRPYRSGKTFTRGGVTFTENDDGSVTVVGTATQDVFYDLDYSTDASALIGKTVTSQCSSTQGVEYTTGVYADTGSGEVATSFIWNVTASTGPRRGVVPNGAVRFRNYLDVRAGTTVNETVYFMTELGSTATEYEPYCGGIPSPNPDYPQPIESIKSVELASRNADGSKSATRTIDLQGHELRSLPDGTHDEVVVHRDGTVELVQRVGYTDMGSKDWITYTAITTRKIYYTQFDGMVPANARGMCDAYKWQSWNPLDEIKHGIFQNHPTLSYAYFCNNETETAADFRESVTGMHAYYPLATPQTIQLPSIDPLPTYHPYTFVDGNGADISARVRVMP